MVTGLSKEGLLTMLAGEHASGCDETTKQRNKYYIRRRRGGVQAGTDRREEVRVPGGYETRGGPGQSGE